MGPYNDFSDLEDMLGDSEMGMEILLGVLTVLLVVALISLVIALIMYIFQSVGLYTAAKRRGIKNPWLAWLPVGSYWIAGSLADQYRYVVNGEVKNRRVVILVLSLVSWGLSMVYQSLMGDTVGTYMDFILSEGMMEYPNGIAGELGLSTGLGTVVSLLQSGVSVAVFVFWQICLYDYYRSCNPNNAVLFLVLGIVFGFLVPFFIFACRKKDGGMPPRREIPQEPAWQPNEPAREPWELN